MSKSTKATWTKTITATGTGSSPFQTMQLAKATNRYSHLEGRRV